MTLRFAAALAARALAGAVAAQPSPYKPMRIAGGYQPWAAKRTSGP